MTSIPTPRRAAGIAPNPAVPPGSAVPRGRTGQAGPPSAPVLGGLATHSSQSPRVPRSAAQGTPDPATAARDLRGVSVAARVRRAPAGGAADADTALPAGQRAIAAAMSEAELLSSITLGTRKRPGMCERYGLTWYHTYNSEKSPSGFPDLVIAGRWVVYRELKRQTENPTKAQREWIAALEAAGADVGVWRPSDWLSGRVQSELAALAGLKVGVA
jgi:hypothetical protein